MTDAPEDVKNLSDDELGALVERTLREFLRDEGGAENATDLGADEPLWSHFDSLLVMELLVHLETRFGVQINTTKFNPDDLKTIARIRDAATKAIRAAQKP